MSTGIHTKRLRKSGGRVSARERLSSPSDCICQHDGSHWYGGLWRRPTICWVHDFLYDRRRWLQENHCNFTLSPSGMICSLYFPVLTKINTDVGKPLKCTCLRMRQRSLTEESWRSVHLICLALSSKIVLFMIEPYSYKKSGELAIPGWFAMREGKLTVNCRIAPHSMIGTEDSRPVFSTYLISRCFNTSFYLHQNYFSPCNMGCLTITLANLCEFYPTHTFDWPLTKPLITCLYICIRKALMGILTILCQCTASWMCVTFSSIAIQLLIFSRSSLFWNLEIWGLQPGTRTTTM